MCVGGHVYSIQLMLDFHTDTHVASRLTVMHETNSKMTMGISFPSGSLCLHLVSSSDVFTIALEFYNCCYMVSSNTPRLGLLPKS